MPSDRAPHLRVLTGGREAGPQHRQTWRPDWPRIVFWVVVPLISMALLITAALAAASALL